MLIGDLTTMQPEVCAHAVSNTSDTHSHRLLIQTLFKLSQLRNSHFAIMQSLALAPWLLNFLKANKPKPRSHVKSAIENATGLLQNISLKSQGIEKVIHHEGQMSTLMYLLEKTSVTCEEDDDMLTLMAATYTLSVFYQLATRKLGKNIARDTGLLTFMQTRMKNLCAMYDKGQGHLVDQALLVQMESICDVLQGKCETISSSSGSMNTSLDDWSDDSDDEVDWQQDSEQALVAEFWLQEEFKISK